MSALGIFNHEGFEIRAGLDENGDPWIAAADVAQILGHRMSSDMTRSLDDDAKGTRLVRTPGGDQQITVLTEPGFYQALMQRQTGRMQAPHAAIVKRFQRWVTGEVIPSIRRTGSYSVPETPEQLMARALIEAQKVMTAKDERIAALEPRAEAWDVLASAEGDYDVAAAAKILSRAGINTGRDRLFASLEELGWIFRNRRHKWEARQSAVDSGYVTELPQWYDHPRTHERMLGEPQVRLTLKGVERLRVRLGTFTSELLASA